MLYKIPVAILMISLIAMIVSDFRCRRIHIIWLGMFACAAGLFGFLRGYFWVVFLNMVLNISLIALMLVGSRGLMLLRYGHRRLKNSIGLGDILFLFAMTPLFVPAGFILFLVISLLASLCWYQIQSGLSGQVQTIPLVATTGMCYLIYSLIKFTTDGLQ